MMHFFITGGAGFIGSNLADRLLTDGHRVTVFDNFVTGFRRFLEKAQASERFRLIEGDLLDTAALNSAMKDADIDTVFHLAANADVRFGTQHPGKDLEQNTVATYNVLEAMRSAGIKKIAFSSTGSVYGEAEVIPTPENAPFPVQTSLYGASKVACEGLIAAYCEGFGFQSWIFRFVSVLGERYTHGHVFDFFKKLREDPSRLVILGDGRQRKSYMYVQDCIEAMLLAHAQAGDKVNIFNLGVDDFCEVSQSARWISGALGISPQFEFTGGRSGWIGDNPYIHLDVTRISKLGWKPALPIQDGILKTLRWLQANAWVYEARNS